jgi:hypothetical protein
MEMEQITYLVRFALRDIGFKLTFMSSGLDTCVYVITVIDDTDPESHKFDGDMHIQLKERMIRVKQRTMFGGHITEMSLGDELTKEKVIKVVKTYKMEIALKNS